MPTGLVRTSRSRPAFAAPLALAWQIKSQKQRQRGWKLYYSFHAPETECIGKGKASAPYEFGVKVSIVTTNRWAPGGQVVLHAKALPGNPYTATPYGLSSMKQKGSRAARSSASTPIRAIAATMRHQTHEQFTRKCLTRARPFRRLPSREQRPGACAAGCPCQSEKHPKVTILPWRFASSPSPRRTKQRRATSRLKDSLPRARTNGTFGKMQGVAS